MTAIVADKYLKFANHKLISFISKIAIYRFNR